MTTDTLELAFEAYDQRRFDEASALCDQLLGTDPENAPALMLAGLIAKKGLRFEEAVSLLEQSIKNEPNPEALAGLAHCLWRMGRLEHALRCVDEVLAAHPDQPDALLLKAAILYGQRRFDAALACVEHAQEILPESHLVAARRGCILTGLGNYEEAEKHFRHAARLMPELGHYGLINFRQGVWRDLEARRGTASPAPIEPWRSVATGQPYDAVVAAVCDARYFFKYGAAFVNSYAQNAAQQKLLHLHIMDPDERFSVYLDDLLARLQLHNVVVTCERTPFADSASYKSRRTYYSCARFLRMGWLLEKYQMMVGCFDIDIVFETSIDAMFGAARGADIALTRREPIDSPWLDILAGYVVANPTGPAQRYIAAVENFIRHFAARDKLFWHLDQIALYCVLTMMERFAEPPRVAWLTPAARAAVWHIGNPYQFRLHDERVARYQIEGLALPAES